LKLSCTGARLRAPLSQSQRAVPTTIHSAGDVCANAEGLQFRREATTRLAEFEKASCQKLLNPAGRRFILAQPFSARQQKIYSSPVVETTGTRLESPLPNNGKR
jgi:hypothetical protein